MGLLGFPLRGAMGERGEGLLMTFPLRGACWEKERREGTGTIAKFSAARHSGGKTGGLEIRGSGCWAPRCAGRGRRKKERRGMGLLLGSLLRCSMGGRKQKREAGAVKG